MRRRKSSTAFDSQTIHSCSRHGHGEQQWGVPFRQRRIVKKPDAPPRCRKNTVFRKRLDHLLRRPGGGWMFRNVEMRNLTSFLQKDDETVKVTEGRGGDGKEIDADDFSGVIGEESLPRLGGRLKCFDSIFGNC